MGITSAVRRPRTRFGSASPGRFCGACCSCRPTGSAGQRSSSGRAPGATAKSRPVRDSIVPVPPAADEAAG